MPKGGPGGVTSGWNTACQSLSKWYVPGQIVVSAALDAAACRDLNKATLLENIRSDAETRPPRGFEIIDLSRVFAERSVSDPAQARSWRGKLRFQRTVAGPQSQQHEVMERGRSGDGRSSITGADTLRPGWETTRGLTASAHRAH